MTLSDQIRDRIANSGKSVYSLSFALRIQQRALHRFVQKQGGLSMKALDRLADYFGLNPADTTGDNAPRQ